MLIVNNKALKITNKWLNPVAGSGPTPPGPTPPIDTPIVYYEDIDVSSNWSPSESLISYNTDFTTSNYLVIKLVFSGGGGYYAYGTFKFKFDSDHSVALRIPEYGQSGPSPVWYGDGTVNILSNNVTRNDNIYTSSYVNRTQYSSGDNGTQYKLIYEKSTGLCTILLCKNDVWEAQVSSVLYAGLNSFTGFAFKTDSGNTYANTNNICIASCNTYDTAFAY